MEAALNRLVGEVMLRDVVTTPRAATLSQVQGLMQAAGLRHLLVVENGIVVGLVSHRAILEASLTALRESVSARGVERLSTTTIERLVHEDPLTIDPESSLETAARRMLALRMGCLPVTTPGPGGPRLQGLITEAGLLRAAYLPAPPRS